MLSGPAPHQLHTPSLRSLMTTMQSAIWTNMDIASSERSVTYEEPGGHDEGIPKQALPPPIPHRHHQQHHRHPHHPLAPGPLWQRREVPPRMVAGPKKVVLSSEDTERKLLLDMAHNATSQQKQQAELIENLGLKLDDLREQKVRVDALCNSARELLRSFLAKDGRFRSEFKDQITNLERYKEEGAPVQALQDRLRAEKEKIEGYKRRIEEVRNKVERHNEMELGKKRVSWRTRLLWGFAALLVILWLQATAGNDGDDIVPGPYSGDAASAATTNTGPIKLIPPVFHPGTEYDLDGLSAG